MSDVPATTRNVLASLSIRERRFLVEVVAGKSGAEAYLAIARKPGLDTLRARAQASRTLKRIREKADWSKILDECELGDLRLIRSLTAMLEAKKGVYFEGELVDTVEDNGTRMRALELLADLLGRRTSKVDVHIDEIQVVPAPRAPAEDPADMGQLPGGQS